MSRTRIVKGKIIKRTEGSYNMYAQDNIVLNAEKEITLFGKEKGINYGTPDKPPEAPDIIAIKWLDEMGKEIGTKKINDATFSNILYGKKVKIEVEVKNTNNQNEVIVEIIMSKQSTFNKSFTVKLNGNKGITPLFLIPIAAYDDSYEEYDYKNYVTTIQQKNVIGFIATIQYAARRKVFTDEHDILKPYTYHRNYEELIGLYSINNNGNKDQKKNYENKFIEYNTNMERIVTEFIEFLDAEKINEAKIKDRVAIDAQKLWDEAIKQAQGYSKTTKILEELEEICTNEYAEDLYTTEVIPAKLDDRPLYWARNKMQTFLKRYPIFEKDINYETSEIIGDTLKQIIQLFEQKSRNYDGIDFSKATGKKKVLITGFDPFQLDPYYYKFDNLSVGPNIFNPAGIAALCLNNNQALVQEAIYVQTCVYPVRYEDFDNKCVEKIVEKYINEVDAIITLSRNNYTWDIEEYAIAYRGGLHDNMNIGNSSAQYNSNRLTINTSSALTKTSLPVEKIFGKSSSTTNIQNEIIQHDTNFSSTRGSGGNYLSNEVMYRSTVIRNNIQSKIPVGHFHLRDLETIGNQNITIDVIKELIKRIVL